jgi:hypothetical protein
MKSFIFWDITPCSPLSDNRLFGGTYRLHLILFITIAVKTSNPTRLDHVINRDIRQQCGIQPIGERILKRREDGIIIYQE